MERFGKTSKEKKGKRQEKEVFFVGKFFGINRTLWIVNHGKNAKNIAKLYPQMILS
jgi:hypothetical protein